MGIVFSIKPSLVVIPCGIFPYDAMVIFGGTTSGWRNG